MLNRIYIIVGLLAITVLAGAFIVPYFIQWSDYRGRMEELATGMLGTPVTVRGDIDFTLLPQPRLQFSDVLVGSVEAPAATVEMVEADFSLLDFLRDNYTMTRLVLRGPVLDFTVDETGFLGSGVTLSEGMGGVVLGQTTIEDATVRLLDRRSGETFAVTELSGDLRLPGFSGPFSFQGTGVHADEPYSLRFTSAALDGAGQAAVSGFIQPQTGAFTLAAEGLLEPGMAPKFDGSLVYRQAPPVADEAGNIQGDLVLESKMTASTDRIVLSGYTLRPDENRAGTRLTGAASVQLGDERSFDAVVSGGVFALPPRDATEETQSLPYEAVRLLSELPAPAIPPMAGRVGIDLAEVGLRGFALRDVRIDARTDGQIWTIEQFVAQMPGDTEIQASGTLADDSGRPALQGTVSVASQRLDGLVALWRTLEDGSALFNRPGRLDAGIMLAGDALGLTDGVLTLGENAHAVEARLGFGQEKRLDLVAHFDALNDEESAAIGDMLPNFAADPAFALSFPQGSFALTGTSARVFGLEGTDLVADGQWGGGEISFTRLAAENWGGLGLNGVLAASGTLAEPALSGSGDLRVESGRAPALLRLYDWLGTPESWRTFVAGLAPAELDVELGQAVEGRQTMTVQGAAGESALTLRADLGAGLSVTAAPLSVVASLESDDRVALGRQIGIGDVPLFSGTGTMLVTANAEGMPGGAFQSSVTASQGDESVSFSGSLIPAPSGEISGSGSLDAALDDGTGLAAAAGASGLSLPETNGRGELMFEGDRLVRLTAIAGTSGQTAFSGDLALSRTAGSAVVEGAVAVDVVSAEGLAAALLGPAALVASDDVWPQGPLELGTQSRATRGVVTVTAGSLVAGGAERLGQTRFELNWDDTRLRLARFEAVADLGTLALDVTVCCSGPLADKTISGRVSLTAVPLDVIAPQAIADELDGLLDGGVQFEGTGASLTDIMASVAGEGNFTITDFAAQQLSPGVFPRVAEIEDVLNTPAEDITTLMGVALSEGPFTAPSAAGAFTIAGGVLRLANLLVDGDGGTLTGGLSLALRSLELAGSFALTPRDFEDPQGLVRTETSRIINRLGGTLTEPETALDLEEMVAAVLVRANEIELDRLEVIRAEDAERQRAAAEERNRLIEEQRQRAAAEAARIAAEEEAARLAEQERLEAERALQEQTTPAPATSPTAPGSGGLNLTPVFPPPNQLTGAGVN